VLDVGCGKGRFARVFHEQEPEAELWGLDISEAMLAFVPSGIHTRAGSMTELPFAMSSSMARTLPNRWNTPWRSRRPWARFAAW
jgi:SAM-dependent methyltransferase